MIRSRFPEARAHPSLHPSIHPCRILRLGIDPPYYSKPISLLQALPKRFRWDRRLKLASSSMASF